LLSRFTDTRLVFRAEALLKPRRRMTAITPITRAATHDDGHNDGHDDPG